MSGFCLSFSFFVRSLPLVPLWLLGGKNDSTNISYTYTNKPLQKKKSKTSQSLPHQKSKTKQQTSNNNNNNKTPATHRNNDSNFL